jgi:hypothetical protein
MTAIARCPIFDGSGAGTSPPPRLHSQFRSPLPRWRCQARNREPANQRAGIERLQSNCWSFPEPVPSNLDCAIVCESSLGELKACLSEPTANMKYINTNGTIMRQPLSRLLSETCRALLREMKSGRYCGLIVEKKTPLAGFLARAQHSVFSPSTRTY